MITYTTINREIAAWIRDFREQWMARANPGWSFLQRFLCALVGSYVSVLWVIVSLTGDTDILLRDVLQGGYLGTPLLLSLLGGPFAVWFAWLVSWKDFGYGPVRLFLSSIFLVTITFSLTRWIVYLASPGEVP